MWICHSQLHTTRPSASDGGGGPTPAQIHLPWSLDQPFAWYCLGLEEPEVSWTHGQSLWPLLCLKKWSVDLLLSSTFNAEQWRVCLNWWTWPLSASVHLKQPYNKAFISTSAFSPVFHILQIPSTSTYFYRCIPSAKFRACQEMWSICAFVSS